VSLDERYGRRPAGANRRPLIAALAVFVAVALAWAVWAAVGLSRVSVTVGRVAVDASDPGLVRVSFGLSLASGRAAVCSVHATAPDGSVVGWADVDVPPSASGSTVATAEIRTSMPASGGGVGTCVAR
jgi:Domain of unknown function (DUF4307)